jgi:hypothetical protein
MSSTWSELQQIIVAQLEKQNLTPIIPFESLLNCDIKKWEEICVANKAHHIELAIVWMYFLQFSDDKNIYLKQMNSMFQALDTVSMLDSDSSAKSTELIKNFWTGAHALTECFGEVSESESVAA